MDNGLVRIGVSYYTPKHVTSLCHNNNTAGIFLSASTN